MAVNFEASKKKTYRSIKPPAWPTFIGRKLVKKYNSVKTKYKIHSKFDPNNKTPTDVLNSIIDGQSEVFKLCNLRE